MVICTEKLRAARLSRHLLAAMAQRGQSAYFLFSEERRAAAREACLAAAEPGARVSVATVAKALGEQWRALSDEERAAYKARAAARASAAKARAPTLMTCG